MTLSDPAEMSIFQFHGMVSELQGIKIYLTGDFSKTFKLLKSKNSQYLGLEAKNEKSKTTLFSPTFKVSENKVPSFSSFLASRPRY